MGDRELNLRQRRDRSPARRGPAIVTFAIVLANLLVFLLPRLLGGIVPAIASYERLLWNHPDGHFSLAWLAQLLTANFVHAGIVHLAVNLFFVVWLCPPLERALGSVTVALFYLGAGVFAYLVYNAYAWLVPGQPTTGGASGCVFALAALYTLIFPREVVPLYGIFPVRFRYLVILLLVSDVSCWIGSLWSAWPDRLSSLNQIVHLSGAAAGFGYGFCFARARPPLDKEA